MLNTLNCNHNIVINEISISDINIDNNTIMFEEDYEDVKKNPNLIWFKYEEKIKKVTNSLAYWKNFDGQELVQQSYIYFVDFCKIYDPYYNNNFIPFNKFLFKNLIIKLRAYIQRYYYKRKREKPSEFFEYISNAAPQDKILSVDDKLYMEYIYSLVSEKQKQILDLSIRGYKQQEIGDELKISQSRVSVVKKNTLNKLSEILEKNN